MKVIIPGFGTGKSLFKEFLKYNKETKFISIPGFSYKEAEESLLRLSEKTHKTYTAHGALDIFGWSLGALFALKFAVLNPESVSSLFLTGATARFCKKTGYENGITQKKLKQMTVLIKRNKEVVMNSFYNSILKFVKNKGEYITMLCENLPDINALLTGLEELNNIDLLDCVGEIRVPVFILHGKYDRTTPPAGARILKDKIGAGVLKEPGGGHSLFIESPEMVAKEWKDFLCTISV